MKHDVWLSKLVKAAPYGSKKRLAKHMGIDSTKLSRILSGARELKIEEMEKAAEFFDAPLPISAPVGCRRNSAGLNVNPALMEEARRLGIDLSRAAEEGIASALKAERERLWKEENRAAIEAANAWVEARGLPLARHRPFRIG